MKAFCKTINMLLYFLVIPFIFGKRIHCMEQKYPQDALRDTVSDIKFSHEQLKKIRCELRSIIDTNEQDMNIAINFTNKKVARFFENRLPIDSKFDTNRKLAVRLDDLHYYTTVYNRISRTLENNKDKKKCKLSYTLFESDYIFKNITEWKNVHLSNKALIEKIKNNTVAIREAVGQKIVDEATFCLRSKSCNGDSAPNEIVDQIIKYVYIIINKPKQYRSARLHSVFYPQDSFDGLSPSISSGTQIPLLAPEVDTSDNVYPTTQIWFRDTVNGIRYSDDYNFIDIHCIMPAAQRLLATEFCNKYLVALYSRGDNKHECSVFSLPMSKRKYKKVEHSSKSIKNESIIVKQYADYSAPLVYAISEHKNKNNRHDTSINFVGIDRHNECFFYEINKKLWCVPLKCNKPRKIILSEYLEEMSLAMVSKKKITIPDESKDNEGDEDSFNIEAPWNESIDKNPSETVKNSLFKKMVSPTRFISFFLTQQGDLWIRLYKSTILENTIDNNNKVFNYKWFKFKQDNYAIDDIAIERWSMLGKFGLALMTKDKKLLCEQFLDDTEVFFRLCKSFEKKYFHALKKDDTHKRLYIHNKKVIELYTDKNGREWFLEVPIAWN